MYNVTQHATYRTKNKRETAVLIGVHAQTDRQFNFESTMEELDALSQTCQLMLKDKSLKIESNLTINIMLKRKNR